MPLPFARTAPQARPTFSRDFAGLKTLDHGAGPSITFTRGSDATYFNAAGTLTTATTNEPRFDHNPSTGASLGLLIEEARTNSIRNSQAGGAVIGAPGTAPTNWNVLVNNGTGISSEIIGTGTSGGFSYVDVKFSGTSTSGVAGQIAVNFETSTQIVASLGQTWTGSVYIALVSGSLSGMTNLQVDTVERSVGGSYLLGQQTTFTTDLTSSLKRFSSTRTFNQATVERTSHRIVGNFPIAATIDFTLRIAAPQLEQGAFATSYIPTTNAAATRAADSAVVTPISSFYNQAEGTLFAEAIANSTPLSGQFPRVLTVGNVTNSNNRVEFYTYLAGAALGIGSAVIAASASEYQVFGAASGVGSVFKASTAFTTNDFRTAINGSLFGAADTSGSLPDPSTLTHLGIGRSSTGVAAGTSIYIRKIAYWPRRLSNTLLQQLTT